MSPSSEEIKSLSSSMDAASRPYEDASSGLRTLQGKIGLGRSQSDPMQKAVDIGAAPAQSAPTEAPPAVTPDAQATSPADPSMDKAVNIGANETPEWPSDISMRFVDSGKPLSSVYSPEVLQGYQRGGETDMPLGDRNYMVPTKEPIKPSGPAGPAFGDQTGSDFTRMQYGLNTPNSGQPTIKGEGLGALAQTGLTGALVTYLQSPGAENDWVKAHQTDKSGHFNGQMPKSIQDANAFADALFQGTIGAGEIDFALGAAAKFLEPRIPGAVESLRSYVSALHSDQAGMARLDMGLTGPDPFDALSKLTDDQLGQLHPLAPENMQAKIDEEIARRSAASGASDVLQSAGLGDDARALRQSIRPSEEQIAADQGLQTTAQQRFNDQMRSEIATKGQTRPGQFRDPADAKAYADYQRSIGADIVPGEPVVFRGTSSTKSLSPDAVPGQRPTISGGLNQRLQGGLTKSEAATPELRYPKEENLGIPAGYKNLPQEMQDMITQNARSIYEDIQKARGGVVPMTQVERESGQVLIDTGILSQVSPRTPITAPGTRALIRAHLQVTSERDALMTQITHAGVNVSDELKARLAVKIFEQNSIQKVIAGARAEWGRVGLEWQKALATGEPIKMRNTYQSIIKAVGKDNLDAVIQRLKDIENDPMLFGNPYAKKAIAERQIKFIDGLGRPSNWDKLDEVYRNAILSIPVTHEAYVMGMSVYKQVEALTNIPTALIDKVLSPIERSGVLGSSAKAARVRGEKYTFNQAIASVAATQAGIPRAFRSWGEAMLHGDGRAGVFAETGRYSMPKAVQNVPIGPLTLPVGDIINAPSHVIAAYTKGLHDWGSYVSMWDQAVALVEKEMPGKSVLNRDFIKRAAEIVSNPETALLPKSPGMTAEMSDASQRAAVNQAMTMREVAKTYGERISLRGQQQGGIAADLRNIRDRAIPDKVPILGGWKPLYRVMPFINIGFNIASQGLEYSPLGFARIVTTVGPERSAVIARAGMGSMFMKFVMDKADTGEMTGATPTDPNERSQWQREGKTPYSIKFGGSWYDITRFEPLATPLKWAAGLNDAWKEMKASPNPTDAAVLGVMALKMGMAVTRSFADMNWNIGISQLGQIAQAVGASANTGDVTKLVSAFGNYAGEQLASQTPFSGLLKRAAQATDPYVRSPRGLVQQLEAMMPGLSALTPKSAPSRYGEDVKRPESQQGLQGMFNPLKGTPDVSDPVDQELNKHKIAAPNGGTVKTLFMTLAAQDIAGFKLNPEEGRLMQTYVGRASHQALARLFDDKTTYNGENYSKLPDPDKVKAIQKTISDARRTGRAATADVIVQGSTTAPETARGMEMRLSLISDHADRALYIEGIQKQGKLTPQASALVTARLREKNKTSPTAAEYLAAAPGVREYLAIPAFMNGAPQEELKQVEEARTAYKEEVRLDKLDGTANAAAYYKAHPLLQQYARVIPRTQALSWLVRENPQRANYRRTHKSLDPFLTGLTYTQETP